MFFFVFENPAHSAWQMFALHTLTRVFVFEGDKDNIAIFKNSASTLSNGLWSFLSRLASFKTLKRRPVKVAYYCVKAIVVSLFSWTENSCNVTFESVSLN